MKRDHGSAPTVAKLHCKTIRFQRDDRVLVEVYDRVDKYQRAKIVSMVQRWAGVPVHVLVVDRTIMEVKVEKAKGGR